MPVIQVDGPRIGDQKTKRAFVKSMTEAAVRAYGLPEETIVILLKENSPENVGVGGILVADRANDE